MSSVNASLVELKWRTRAKQGIWDCTFQTGPFHGAMFNRVLDCWSSNVPPLPLLCAICESVESSVDDGTAAMILDPKLYALPCCAVGHPMYPLIWYRWYIILSVWVQQQGLAVPCSSQEGLRPQVIPHVSFATSGPPPSSMYTTCRLVKC